VPGRALGEGGEARVAASADMTSAEQTRDDHGEAQYSLLAGLTTPALNGKGIWFCLLSECPVDES